jgi:PEP-CTERM motif
MIGKAIARAAFAALFAAWFAAPNLAHADVTVGAPPASSGDCIPFGCNFFDVDEGFDFQQVYGSTNFSTPITITDLEFFNTVDFSGGGTEAQAGSYVLSLSTTQAKVDGLSTALSDNLGPDNTIVYSGGVPTLSGGVLRFVLSTPFTYDPSKGNLLLDAQIDYGDTEGLIFFDANGVGGLASRALFPVNDGGFADGAAIVTRFSTTVPEPSTWAMMLIGFAGLAYAYRTTRRTAARAG